jgi:hypothetical protein
MRSGGSALSIRTFALAGALLIAALGANPCLASHQAQTDSTPLIKLAASKFPDLTKAERAALLFAAASNVDGGQFAVAGSSADPADSSNDPRHAGEWPHERDIRASLIMWLCEDPAATPLVNRAGIKILGARIVGGLDLSYVRVPIALAMLKCSIAERIILIGTEIPHLDLSGSYVSEIDAKGLIVHGDLDLANGFHASGETRIENAKIDGGLNCSGGSFHYSKVSLSQYAGTDRPALILDESTIGSEVDLDFGFHSDGAVMMREATVATDLDMFGARISNPDNVAFRCNFSSFDSVWIGSPPIANWGSFEAVGTVEFTATKIRGGIFVNDARFLGTPGSAHGFFALGMTSGSFLYWRNIQLQNGATVDLSSAHVGILADEEKSWPEPGKLLIDGLTYNGFGGGSPLDVPSRMRWILLQPQARGVFRSQPYRQLANVYRESGLDNEAIRVLIAEQDARYARYGPIGGFWGDFLKDTIGYGHRPMLAIFWSLAVIWMGWLMVTLGERAGVMRATWPENPPATEKTVYQRLYPLLYSLDAFLPFVNLHQEHYWWPDADRSGECTIFGWKFGVRGSLLQYYLWLQIMSGWLLSAIFVAGITGLLRND